MPETQSDIPWWLEPGTEICPTCQQLYLFEMEVRCVDCDAAICDNCVDANRCVGCRNVTE